MAKRKTTVKRNSSGTEWKYVFPDSGKRCPNPKCNSHVTGDRVPSEEETKAYSTQGKIQYRRCMACGENYKVIGEKVEFKNT